MLFFCLLLKFSSLFRFFVESANIPLDNKGKTTLDAVTFAEGSSAKVQSLLELTKTMLGRLHKTIFPKAEPPASLAELVATFDANTDNPIEVHRRAGKYSGALYAYQVLKGHGISGNLLEMSKTLPSADGELVDLKKFRENGKKFAKRLIALMEPGLQKQGDAKTAADSSAQTAAP